MKKRARLIDFLVGLLLACLVVGSYFMPGGGLLEPLELRTYDLRAQLRGNLDPSSEIVIIAIDDESIENLGRWPWPRNRIGEMLRLLNRAAPKVIGLDILYTEMDRNPGLIELKGLQERYRALVRKRRIVQRKARFEAEFAAAAGRLDGDSQLLSAMATVPQLVLPMYFVTSGVSGEAPAEPPEALRRSILSVKILPPNPGRPPARIVEARAVSYPLVPFLRVAEGSGHVTMFKDSDGVIRRETPAILYGKHYYPSFALQLVARYRGIESKDITVTPGRSVEFDGTTIPLDETQSMLVTFSGDRHTFRYYSFHEVLGGKVPLEVFKDKIVILGPSARGIAKFYATPLSRSLPSVEFIANVAENILNRRFLTRPEWAMKAELIAVAVAALFIMLILPRLRVLASITVTVLLVGLVLGVGAYLLKERAEWVKVSYPAFLFAAGCLASMLRRILLAGYGAPSEEELEAQGCLILGLRAQAQEQLDEAFEKFQLCPQDENLLEVLYQLGLDFEGKRKFSKAVSVYKHMAVDAPGFKDIAEKLEKLKDMKDGALLGARGAGGLLAPDGEKAVLGRYEIEK
ncbi:MAG: CHASE2 domain-containing protein, partial [Elusimicrobiota bacterium]